jgi:ABC-type phosphate transport system substrate-binding protein
MRKLKSVLRESKSKVSKMDTNNRRRLFCRFATTALLLLSFGSLAEVLVVTGADSPPVTLSKDQISDIFLGKIVSLPGGNRVTPVDQPESNPLRNEFYMKVANKSAAQAKALWAKLYFTGRGEPPREARDDDDIKKIVNSTQGAIGYIDKAAVDKSVKVLLIVQ